MGTVIGRAARPPRRGGQPNQSGPAPCVHRACWISGFFSSFERTSTRATQVIARLRAAMDCLDHQLHFFDRLCVTADRDWVELLEFFIGDLRHERVFAVQRGSPAPPPGCSLVQRLASCARYPGMIMIALQRQRPMNRQRDAFAEAVALHAFDPRAAGREALDVLGVVFVFPVRRQGRARHRVVVAMLDKVAVALDDIFGPELLLLIVHLEFAVGRSGFVSRMGHDLHVVVQGRFEILKLPDELGVR